MTRNWKKINSRVVYENQWIKIHEDTVIRDDKTEGIYGFLEKKPGSWIIALDDEDCVYLIGEYRYPIKKIVFQIPAGVIDAGDAIKQAEKELFQETGIKAKKWERLGGFYQGPGHETTYANVFLAQDLDLSELKITNQENDEGIEQLVKVSLADLKKDILSGKIECGMTLAAFNLFFLKREKL